MSLPLASAYFTQLVEDGYNISTRYDTLRDGLVIRMDYYEFHAEGLLPGEYLTDDLIYKQFLMKLRGEILDLIEKESKNGNLR